MQVCRAIVMSIPLSPVRPDDSDAG